MKKETLFSVNWGNGNGDFLVVETDRNVFVAFLHRAGEPMPAGLISKMFDEAIPRWREIAIKNFNARRREWRLDVEEDVYIDGDRLYMMRRLQKKGEDDEATAALHLSPSGGILSFQCMTVGELLPIINTLETQPQAGDIQLVVRNR